MTSRPPLSYSLAALAALLSAPLLAAQEAGGTGGAPVTLTLEVDQTTPGPGAKAAGVVNWMSMDRALGMFVDAGGQGATFRRNLRLNDPSSIQFRDDLKRAHDRGLNLWVTVMGTPDGLASTTTGVDYGTGLSPSARSMPTDPAAWADRLVAEIDALQSEYGIVPDFVEIWNEPDRPEYFSGSLQDYLTLYTFASERLRGAYPGIRIGGMGVAISSATMGGSVPALEALVDHAAANLLPLDFLSWHHYEFTNSMGLDHTPTELRQHAATLGYPMLEMVVSEWNIHPSITTFPLDFDRAEAAANLAGFITTALDEGVDRNLFFQLVDVHGESGAPDLQGGGMGSLTEHGIKKPTFLLLETMLPMLAEDRVKTTSEVSELGVRAMATRSGNRVRLVLSNVPVNTDWLLEERAQDLGYNSADFLALVTPAFRAAASNPPTVAELMAGGLDEAMATAALDIYLEHKSARASRWAPRNVQLKIRHAAGFTLGAVTRFDDDHNDISTASLGHLDSFIHSADEKANRLTLEDMAAYMTSMGRPTTYQELAAVTDFEALAQNLGLDWEVTRDLEVMYRDRLMDNKLASQDELNGLPFLQVSSELAEDSGVIDNNGLVTLTMPPHSVLIMDIELN